MYKQNPTTIPIGWFELHNNHKIKEGDKFHTELDWRPCRSSVGKLVRQCIVLKPIIRKIKR